MLVGAKVSQHIVYNYNLYTPIHIYIHIQHNYIYIITIRITAGVVNRLTKFPKELQCNHPLRFPWQCSHTPSNNL